MDHLIKAKYWLGDVVYQRVAAERLPGMVIRVTVTPAGVAYAVSFEGGFENTYYEMELTTEYIPEYVEGREEDNEKERVDG